MPEKVQSLHMYDKLQKFILENEDFFADEEALQSSLDFVAQDYNLTIMQTVVEMLEKSFWWKFISLNTRLKMIEKTFRKFKKLQEE